MSQFEEDFKYYLLSFKFADPRMKEFLLELPKGLCNDKFFELYEYAKNKELVCFRFSNIDKTHKTREGIVYSIANKHEYINFNLVENFKIYELEYEDRLEKAKKVIEFFSI